MWLIEDWITNDLNITPANMQQAEVQNIQL